MVFPIVMYGCERWTIKKVESWRTDACEVWFGRRLFRVPQTSSSPNQWILKEISPEYSLEGLILNLELQYFGHLMRSADSLEKSLMLGKIEDRRRTTEDEMVGWHHWLDGHEFEQTLGDVEGQKALVCCSPWCYSQTRLSDWTIATTVLLIIGIVLYSIFLELNI